MDETESEEPIGAAEADPSIKLVETDGTAEANALALGLRGQIAALRRQVRDAQDTLRGQPARAKDERSLKS